MRSENFFFFIIGHIGLRIKINREPEDAQRT